MDEDDTGVDDTGVDDAGVDDAGVVDDEAVGGVDEEFATSEGLGVPSQPQRPNTLIAKSNGFVAFNVEYGYLGKLQSLYVFSTLEQYTFIII